MTPWPGRAGDADVVLIDTAGRLRPSTTLMEELRKVAAVVGKVDPDAPHEVLLVLDATTGQNGPQPGAAVRRGRPDGGR